jgi:hypothetical protein
MSRAYRIRVAETLARTLRAEDEISTCLEVLEVLPAEQMAQLLREELERRGFTAKDGELVRPGDDGVTTAIDPATGTVTIRAKAARVIELEGHREGLAYDDLGPGEKAVRRELQKQTREDMEKQAEHEQEKLQTEATRRLEGHLADLQKELNQAVNRVTAEALKRKAAQLGQIKELTEDPQSGSLTITLEV